MLILVRLTPAGNGADLCPRYLEVCEDTGPQKNLTATALSCMLNTAACQLKLEQWQDAIDNCNEVGQATRNPRPKMVAGMIPQVQNGVLLSLGQWVKKDTGLVYEAPFPNQEG